MNDRTEYQVLIDSIKKILKERNIQYKDLSVGLNTTESNIKKMMNAKDGKINTINKLCGVLKLSVFELYKYTFELPQQKYIFNEEQEDLFTQDFRCFSFYFEIVTMHKSTVEIAEDYQLSREEIKYYVDALTKVGLLKIDARGNIIPTQDSSLWFRSEGLLQKYYRNEYARLMMDHLVEKYNRNLDKEYFYTNEMYIPEDVYIKLLRQLERLTRDLYAETSTHEKFRTKRKYVHAGMFVGAAIGKFRPAPLTLKKKIPVK